VATLDRSSGNGWQWIAPVMVAGAAATPPEGKFVTKKKPSKSQLLALIHGKYM